jgi:hypothetical protein
MTDLVCALATLFVSLLLECERWIALAEDWLRGVR